MKFLKQAAWRAVIFLALILAGGVLVNSLSLRGPSASLPGQGVTGAVNAAATSTNSPATGKRHQADAPLAGFGKWVESHLATAENPSPASLTEGEALASRRREFLRELIRTDPAAALAAAVPVAIRAQLPASIRAELEERVSGRGFLGVLIATDFEHGTSEVRREVLLNGRRFDAFVYGSRLAQGTRENTPLHGIAVGDRLAVHQNPIRVLELGEPAPAGEGNCPVSGRASNLHGSEALGEIGGVVERFCGAGHLTLLNERLAGDSGGGAGGGEPPVAADSWSQGPKTCLLMRPVFPDDPSEPITEDAAYALLDTMNQWFVENSYGTTSLTPTVTPLLMLPQPKAFYTAQGTSRLLADTREAARLAGFDTDNYNWDIVRHTSVPGFSWSGLAYIHGKGTWLQSSGAGVAVHELGHNYGLWHANSWAGNGDSVIGPGAHSEYGNSFDTMGAASAGANQFNAAFKNQLDWLPDAFVRTITGSGTFRLHTFDVPVLTPGRHYALRVKKNYDRNYWAEFRQKFTANRWFQNGILLNWDPWSNGVTNSANGTHLLDTTPGTAAGKDDGGVIIGRTFSDWPAGVHLTPVGRGTLSPENWIDVVVNLGAFPSNRPPSLVLAPDSLSAPTNSAINFVASASDPDGDALAYWWDFGDGSFGPNDSFASKSWATTGVFTVRCTVSDMKGGIFNQKAVITIGTPTNAFRASGRIATGAGEPVEGARVHNGLAGAAYRGTYTDSDGHYELSGLPGGSNTISAVKYGYALSRTGWTNPIVFGSAAAGLDWSAAAAPVVSVAALDAAIAEASPAPGVFRLSRLNGTNAPLTVKMNRTGTAATGSDYFMSPAPTNLPLQIVIPAGAAFLDLSVTPLGDSLVEGPEFITLTLIEDAAYVLGPLAEATMTVNDDDSGTKPTVSVNSTSSTGDNLATETGNDTGAFTFTRSGSVAGELIVFYTVTGTATAGTDYTALAGAVSIPAAESSSTIAFTVLDDLLVESNETVTVTLLANAAYTVSGGAATVIVTDDDPTTVTITATDNLAREAGGNSGAFLVTRQGSLAANFVVNYSLSGTASNTADFSTLSGAVTILAGRATATITVSPVNDSVVEGAETVICTLLSSPSCNVGNPASATLTIIDDEIPSVTLAVSDATATEPGVDTGSFTFTRSRDTNLPLTVFFAVHGTAVSGLDFAPPGGSVTFAIGDTNAVLTVTPLDDTVKEADEKVTLTLLPDAAYSIGTTTPQTVTIKDNDGGGPVAVGFTFATSANLESVTFVQLSVGLSTNSSSTVTVDYIVSAGTATAGADFTATTGRLSFTSGTLNQSVSLSVVNDSATEANETILVRLLNPTNAVLDAITNHVFTIIDDDESGAVTVTAIDPVASETGPDPGVFRIARSGATGSALTVSFQLVGPADSPSDFAPVANPAVIPAGASFVDVVITPVDDATPETNETVVLNLISAPRARLGSPDIATVTILDNDSNALPVLTITAADALASEPGADTATFTLARDRGTNAPLTVVFTVTGTASSGTDFTSLGTSATIPAGAFSTNITLTVRDDAAFETNETVIVTLTVTSNYLAGISASATAVILDNEAGVFVVSAGATDEEGLVSGEFVITRTGNTASNLTVNFTVAGTAGVGDFVPLGTDVVIPAGSNLVVLPVVAIDDSDAEGNEAVFLTLAAGSGYAVTSPGSAALVIFDDEAAVAVTAGVGTPYEGDGTPGFFHFARTGNTNFPLTIHFTLGGTADNGLDYAAVSSAIVFPGGSNAVDLWIAPLDDALIEGDETVLLTLTPHATYSVLAPGAASLAIVDDEVNQLPSVALTSPAVASVFLANTNSLLVLEATASDDGLPGPLALSWSLVSGPGGVAFGDAVASNTTARFSAEGVHFIRVTAIDGQLSASADVRVSINTGTPTNIAPQVEAGPAQTLALGSQAVLEGAVFDDGQPAALTSWWAKVSGPGDVGFVDPSDPATSAMFSTGGVFILRLTASDGDVRTADELTITVTQPPTVRIQAVENTAGEFSGFSQGGSQGGTGVFTVSRAGDTAPLLNVRLAFDGTASNGVDYLPLAETLQMQPGQGSVSLVVRPLADTLAEGEETVVVSLVPDAAYIIGSPAMDTVYLADAPWDDWRFQNFSTAELSDPFISGEAVDPDVDGLRNLLEYAFDRDPKSADADPGFHGAIEEVPGPAGGASGFVVTFHRRLAPRDIDYTVEVSDDLVNWQSGRNVTQELFPPLDDGNGVTETVRVQILGSLTQPGQKFVRLKVTRL